MKTTSQDQDDLPQKLKIIFLVFQVIVHQIFFYQIFGKIMLDFWYNYDFLFNRIVWPPAWPEGVCTQGNSSNQILLKQQALVGNAYNPPPTHILIITLLYVLDFVEIPLMVVVFLFPNEPNSVIWAHLSSPDHSCLFLSAREAVAVRETLDLKKLPTHAPQFL